MMLPNVTPSRFWKEPSQPPLKTRANAFSRPEEATSKPGVCQVILPPENNHTSQRTTSPSRQLTSTARPNAVFGSVHSTPNNESRTPPKLQCPSGSKRLTGSFEQ